MFLALTWGRLVARVGLINPLSLAFLGYLFASAAVILWSGPEPTPWRWRVRLLFYPALMGLSFYLMPSVIAALGVPRADALLVKWDGAWLGQNFNLAIQGWEPPPFTDALMLAYVFFFYYLIAGPAYYCVHDLTRFRQCFAGLFVVYALGFIGYTFWPAGGPHRFLEFAQPLAGGWITGRSSRYWTPPATVWMRFPAYTWPSRCTCWSLIAGIIAAVSGVCSFPAWLCGFQPFICVIIIVWTWWLVLPLPPSVFRWPPGTRA